MQLFTYKFSKGSNLMRSYFCRNEWTTRNAGGVDLMMLTRKASACMPKLINNNAPIFRSDIHKTIKINT